MQWWTDFLDWLNSDNGWRIVSTAVIPFVAIVVAGIVAAGIGRASARKVIELSEREVRASAVTALISAARKAAVWNTLPAPEQQHIDHLIGDAEIRLRLLPIAGTALAADWSSHEIAGMKRNAISFSFQAEQSLLVFRDRLIEWQGRPSRAKKLFKNDLDSWAYNSSASEQELVHQQQKWAAQQVTETGPINTVTTTPFTRPLPPAPIQAPLVESATAASAGLVAGITAASFAAAPVEPTFSSPESSLPAGDEPHPLVEPADTSSHDVSEASIFGGNPPQEIMDSENTEPEHAAPEPSEPDDDHETSSEDAGTSEHQSHDGHDENHDHDHDHGHHDHDENGHDENGHDENGHDENGHDENGHDEHQHDEWRG